MPGMTLEHTGYGAGTRVYEKFPNALRVLIGEERINDRESEHLWMLETNIDDMSPQVFGHVMERAFELGALDCYFTAIQMKKNRPGVLLSILAILRKENRLVRWCFLKQQRSGYELTSLSGARWSVKLC
jgi:hypothetical protein